MNNPMRSHGSRVVRVVWCTLFFVVAAVSCLAETGAATAGKAASLKVPLSFEQNQGQADQAIRFMARTGHYRLFLTNHGTVLKVAGQKGLDAVLRTTLVGANPVSEIEGIDKRTWTTNYIVGSQSDWKSAVPNFARVKYTAVYPGVDLIYHGEQQQLEYDFVVSPHANPSSIRLRIEGANEISVATDGSLVLQTAAGAVSWKKPVVFQKAGGRRKLVSARYSVSGDEISFRLGAYDRNKPLVIDPALTYGTYVDGATGFDRYTSLLVDSAGYAYVLGYTSSTDFPTTPGALQRQGTLGDEVYVSKLSQDGSALVWSAIIGGSGPNNNSFGNGFALDAVGDLYIVGSTVDLSYDQYGNPTYYPSTFPTTSGAYNTNKVTNWRYFLLQLNSSGSALIYSTFLSDQPNIASYAVAVDVSGNAYVTGPYSQANGGWTNPFPCTSGAYQCNYAGSNDAFVMKFNPQASKLDYATLVGGSASDDASQILVDSAGEATIGGSTYSTNYPITPNGLRQTDEGGFVTTLNSQGTGLVFSTVLNHVSQLNLKRDLPGNYYVGGSAGTDLPVTSNAYQSSFPAVGTGIHLGFLTVIDTTGKLSYSSYIGGNPPSNRFPEDTQVQLVSPSSVTVVGDRYADTAFPVTNRAYEQDTCSFLAKFNPHASSGSASLVSSGCTPINKTDNLVTETFRGYLFFGGASMFLDNHNHLYGLSAAGQTSSNAFQKSPPQPASGEGSHIWVGKYNMAAPNSAGINLSMPYQWGPPVNYPVEYRATARSPQCAKGIAAMRLYLSPGVWANTTTGATLNAYIAFPTSGSYNTVIVAYDNCGNAFTLNVPELIQASDGSMGSIGVMSPIDSTVVSSPVHYVANAQAPACSAGVAAMRIYTAPGVSAYTVDASSLNTYVKLAPGSYNTVIQSWDNCGHVYTAPVNITVH